MRFMCACVCAIVLLVGCDAAPTAPGRLSLPSPGAVPAPTSAPTPAASGTLVGVVTAAGAPVPGARVIVMGVDWPGNFVVESDVATDANGQYSVPDVRPVAWAVWHLVGASKPGHFADFKWWMDFPSNATFDLELAPLVYSSLGEVIRGQVGEARCAGLGYGGWYGRDPCQRFAFTAPRSGTLNVTVSAPVFNFDVDIVRPDGTFASYAASSSSPIQLNILVDARSTYEVRVAAVGPARNFELTAALR